MKGLMLHCGGQLAQRDAVFAVPVPQATETYAPLAYESFVTRIEKSLAVEGITIKESRLAIAKEGQRLFGLMELQMPSVNAVDYACVLGLRTSYDRSFCTSLVTGNTVFVCDNLSFNGELSLNRKHTPGALKDIGWFLTELVEQLPAKFREQSERFAAFKAFELSDARVHDLAIRFLDAGALNVTDIPDLLKEYRDPRHPEFRNGKTAWRLFNASTEVLKGDLWRLPARTQKIHQILDAEIALPA